jgi:hypothetical protein
MSDDFPLDYDKLLQEVGHGLFHGTLDRPGAISKLVRHGWDREEATAVVAEVAEQVETTKKLLRDAARVLDDTPLGQARAVARVQEAGLSQSDAKSIVDQFNQQRHRSRGRLPFIVQGLHHRHLTRSDAVRALTQPSGMDEIKAGMIVDLLTDSAAYWSREGLVLWTALSAGSMAIFAVIASFLWNDLFGWLGVAAGLFVLVPTLMSIRSWRIWRYWNEWMVRNDGTRQCPRNCTPMNMLAQGKGMHATVLTCAEWGISREEAWEWVGQRRRSNLRDHLWIVMLGLLLSFVAAGTVISTLIIDMRAALPITLLAGAIGATAGIFIWRGMLGWRRFSKM